MYSIVIDIIIDTINISNRLLVVLVYWDIRSPPIPYMGHNGRKRKWVFTSFFLPYEINIISSIKPSRAYAKKYFIVSPS